MAALTIEELIRRVEGRRSNHALLRRFTPPPRFADKRFETYHPDPAYPSQAAARQRLRGRASALRTGPWGRVVRRVRSALGRRTGGGTYLDGGFGVGKTHLLASLWHAGPAPKAYLSFDELVFTIGLLGVSEARALFARHRLIAVDEWELDDPGNLQLALAFLRGALATGAHVAVTSNTIPDELGRGRFSQKEFTAEIEELSAAFDVIRIEGRDYRHRRFEATPGRDYFVAPDVLERRAEASEERVLYAAFDDLLDGLAAVHPIRYAELASSIDGLFVKRLAPVERLPRAIRWVHFVDKLYDAGVPATISSDHALGDLFPERLLAGPFGKKFSRCLSRLEEILVESDAPTGRGHGSIGR